MKPLIQPTSRSLSVCTAVYLIAALAALGEGDGRLAGIWTADQGYRTVELLFRSNGRYQLLTRSSASEFGAIEDRGRY